MSAFGFEVGIEVGLKLGIEDGYTVGIVVGFKVGSTLAADAGFAVGFVDGLTVGAKVGSGVGHGVGAVDGIAGKSVAALLKSSGTSTSAHDWLPPLGDEDCATASCCFHVPSATLRPRADWCLVWWPGSDWAGLWINPPAGS